LLINGGSRLPGRFGQRQERLPIEIKIVVLLLVVRPPSIGAGVTFEHKLNSSPSKRKKAAASFDAAAFAIFGGIGEPCGFAGSRMDAGLQLLS
jgi:hypothetical protein